MSEKKKMLALDLAPKEVQWFFAHVQALERSVDRGGGGFDRTLLLALLPRLRAALAALGGL